ncbi:MAG: metallophosphoesterase, partial [bacterium]
FTLCGVDDPRAWSNDAAIYAARLRELPAAESYAVLLAHRPEYAELYAECGFDLVLSGHAHGGQWRVPGLLNGLFAPNQGLFPKYTGGVYQIDDTTMVVSRGLARESTRVPRFYNRPELVIVELDKNGASHRE